MELVARGYAVNIFGISSHARRGSLEEGRSILRGVRLPFHRCLTVAAVSRGIREPGRAREHLGPRSSFFPRARDQERDPYAR